jgi:hypothetical protein
LPVATLIKHKGHRTQVKIVIRLHPFDPPPPRTAAPPRSTRRHRLVVGGDDDDAAVGDGVALILLGIKPIDAARMSTSRSMIARRMRAYRPTRTPGIRMHCSMRQKLWTRTFGTARCRMLPDTMQRRDHRVQRPAAAPARFRSTNFAGGTCG